MSPEEQEHSALSAGESSPQLLQPVSATSLLSCVESVFQHTSDLRIKLGEALKASEAVVADLLRLKEHNPGGLASPPQQEQRGDQALNNLMQSFGAALENEITSLRAALPEATSDGEGTERPQSMAVENARQTLLETSLGAHTQMWVLAAHQVQELLSWANNVMSVSHESISSAAVGGISDGASDAVNTPQSASEAANPQQTPEANIQRVQQITQQEQPLLFASYPSDVPLSKDVLREFDVCLSQGEPLDLSLASRQVDTESRGTVEYAVVQLVTEGSLVYALGVCVGDVITRINGHPALYSKLSLVYQEIHSETRPQTVSFARIAAENAENVLKRPPQHWLHEDSDHAQIAAVSAVRAQEQRLALTGLRTMSLRAPTPHNTPATSGRFRSRRYGREPARLAITPEEPTEDTGTTSDMYTDTLAHIRNISSGSFGSVSSFGSFGSFGSFSASPLVGVQAELEQLKFTLHQVPSLALGAAQSTSTPTDKGYTSSMTPTDSVRSVSGGSVDWAVATEEPPPPTPFSTPLRTTFVKKGAVDAKT